MFGILSLKKKRLKKVLQVIALQQLKSQLEVLIVLLIETDTEALQKLLSILALNMLDKKVLSEERVGSLYTKEECVNLLWEELRTLV